jgi:flagellar basal-body rod protein FlgB
MSGLDSVFRRGQEALELLEQRSHILSSNIANASTPNYKARDIDFKAALRSRLDTGDLMTTAEEHYSSGKGTPSGDVQYRIPVSSVFDGNTVELGYEQVAFSENALRYQASLDFLSAGISRLKKAIAGE